MNKENINKAIAVMKRAKNLQMTAWQNSYEIAQTEDELHTCGNTACFAGYIAISPEFPGTCNEFGVPEMAFGDGGKVLGSWAILHWFELDEDTPQGLAVHVVIYGNLPIGLEIQDVNVSTLAEETEPHIRDEMKIAYRINKMVGGTSWENWKPEHVIKILEALRDGEFDEA